MFYLIANICHTTEGNFIEKTDGQRFLEEKEYLHRQIWMTYKVVKLSSIPQQHWIHEIFVKT